MSDYGTDVSTYPDLDATFGAISGPRTVAESVARSLETLLQTALNADLSPVDVAVISAACRREALRDERVIDANVTVTVLTASESIRVTAALDLIEGESFSLVLNVSAVTADLLLGADA